MKTSIKKINQHNLAELEIELRDVLIVVHRSEKYVVRKEGYELITELIDEYGDDYPQDIEIKFYITDDLELILYNSLFTVIQKAYLSNSIKYNFLDQEIKLYEDKLHKLSGKTYFDHHTKIIQGFEDLINCETSSEKELEKYICEHFKVILGMEYSKVKSQVMARRFIENTSDERRFDVFAFNSGKKEWELFELKRSKVKMSRAVRGIPMFTSKVNESIAQIRYYKTLLIQDDIRKQIKNEYNIEINVPKYTLIIGGGNTTHIKKCQSEITDVEVITYTQLLEKAKAVVPK